MSLRVVQTPESLADIALQADYYAQRENVALAQRFIDAVKATVRLLAGHPWIGKETDYTHPKLAGIRLFLVRKPFDKHLIFYRVCGDTLDVVARSGSGTARGAGRVVNASPARARGRERCIHRKKVYCR